jgi:hypothetical protein
LSDYSDWSSAMNANESRRGSQTEKNLAAAIGNLGHTKDEIASLAGALPAAERFVMRSDWVELARDSSLENWRRLEACKLLFYRCITYPCNLDYFLSETIVPLGIDQGQIVEMTMAQALPFERKPGVAIRMVNLPIWTSVGPAAVYFAVRISENIVEQAAVYPSSV